MFKAQETHASIQGTLESNQAYSTVIRASSDLLRDIRSVAKALKAWRDSAVGLDEEANMDPTIECLLKVLALTGFRRHQASCSTRPRHMGL